MPSPEYETRSPTGSETCCLTQSPGSACEEEQRASCPAPLSWQEVLQEFRAESTPWELQREGYTLRGRTWGAGCPVYFLNGIGGTHELFALTVWLLREHCQCTLYDYPDHLPDSGTHATDKATRRAGERRLADDLFAIADSHGDDRFLLYATSFGTLVGLTAMLERPGRIERAVLQGGFASRELSRVERLLVRLGRYLPGTLNSLPLRRQVERYNHRRWFPPFDETRWQFFLDDTGQVPTSAVAERAALLQTCDLRRRLGEVTSPVLLIRSEGEGLVSTDCHGELENGLHHARTEWLPGSGHLPYLTHPHRLAKLIRSFLLEEE